MVITYQQLRSFPGSDAKIRDWSCDYNDTRSLMVFIEEEFDVKMFYTDDYTIQYKFKTEQAYTFFLMKYV